MAWFMMNMFGSMNGMRVMLFDYGVNLLFDQEGNFDSRKRNEKKMGINKID